MNRLRYFLQTTRYDCAIYVTVACIVIALSIGSAKAWYFAEHAELTRTALEDNAAEFVKGALRSAVADGNAVGFQICPGLEVRFADTELERDWVATCVPYGALTALAGDHARDVTELRNLLGLRKERLWPGSEVELAKQITGVAVKNWKSLLEDADNEDVQTWNQIVPMASNPAMSQKTYRRYSVADLDLELTVLDTEYLTRAMGSKAHFQNATQPLYQLLKQLLSGDIDNALAQTLVHHARSIQLALLSRQSIDEDRRIALVSEALLEHAFAVHFMEDGFAAGHLAVDASYVDSYAQKERHDYFNRQGIEMTRALEPSRCGLDNPAQKASWRRTPRCWVGHGDGFATNPDRWVVGEAIARLQTVFALALIDSPNTPSILDNAEFRNMFESERKGNIEWLLDPELETRLGYRVLMSHSFQMLKAVPVASARKAGTLATQLFAHDSTWLGCPLGENERQDWSCKETDTELLWRSILVDWPTSTASLESLEGLDGIGGGISYQFTGRGGLGCFGAIPCQSLVSATATGTVGLGLSIKGILPKRRQYSLIEANAGAFFSPRLGIVKSGRIESGVVVEVRMPITTLLLMGAAYIWRSKTPMTLVDYGCRFGVFGSRMFFYTSDERLQTRGWDLEVLDIRLNSADERIFASRANATDTELRFHLGFESLGDRLKKPFDGVFTIKAEVVGGYYGYF